MTKTFTLKLLSTVFLSGVLLSQSAGASQQAAIEAQRRAQRATSAAEVQAAYAQSQSLPARLQGPTVQIIQNKAIELPMVMPGVEKPVHIDEPTFEAMASAKEFKQLPVQKQKEILHQLDHDVDARGVGPVTNAEIQAAVHAVEPTAVAKIVAPMQVKLAEVVHGHGALAMEPALHRDILAIPAVEGLTAAEKNRVLAAVRDGILANPPGAARDANIPVRLAALAIGAIDNAAQLLILGAVNHIHPLVLVNPGLAGDLYDDIRAIPQFAGLAADIEHQNLVLLDVHNSMVAHPHDAATREAAIRVAIGVTGGAAHALGNALTDPIVAAVNVRVPRTTNPGLAANLYTDILGIPQFAGLAPDIAHQNLVLVDVHNSMVAHPHEADLRDAAIRAAIALTGGAANALGVALTNPIVAAVDLRDPTTRDPGIAGGWYANLIAQPLFTALPLAQKNAILATVHAPALPVANPGRDDEIRRRLKALVPRPAQNVRQVIVAAHP